MPLTRGERAFLSVWALVALGSPPVGVVLLVYGSGTRTAGIVLLGVALLTSAVPVSPFLRARVRRREKERAESVG